MGAAHSSPEICWAISGIPLASFNAAIRLRAAPDPETQIDEIQQTFAQRAMPFVWWVTDADKGLEPQLRQHGFDYYGDESIGMAMTLPGPSLQTPAVETLSVERVAERRDVRTWFATLLQSFGATPDEQTLEAAATVYTYLSNDSLSGWHLYLARLGSRPVGTGALHLGSTAGLYSVGTIAEARRWGVGTALTTRALTDANSAGQGIATLTASGLGARLYRAIGFKEYCRFREYVWRPPQG
jgi:GNAT superfamily N-acetyltransferase